MILVEVTGPNFATFKTAISALLTDKHHGQVTSTSVSKFDLNCKGNFKRIQINRIENKLNDMKFKMKAK